MTNIVKFIKIRTTFIFNEMGKNDREPLTEETLPVEDQANEVPAGDESISRGFREVDRLAESVINGFRQKLREFLEAQREKKIQAMINQLRNEIALLEVDLINWENALKAAQDISHSPTSRTLGQIYEIRYRRRLDTIIKLNLNIPPDSLAA